MRRLMVTVLLCSACNKDNENPWLLEAADLGADVATADGYAMEGGSAAWLAAAQVLPNQVWIDPGYELPLAIWDEIVEDESIADEGSCPYVVAEGPTLTWISNCRSQDGYDWSGSVSRTDGEQDGRVTTLWEMDLEVIADTDYPRFTRVMMAGSVLITEGDGDLIEGVQTNLVTAVEDFESVAQGDDTQKAVWSSGWALSARYEEQHSTDGTLLVTEGATELGEYGGLSFSGTALSIDDLCPAEPEGVFTLKAASEAELAFDGLTGACDQCADVTLDGVNLGETCRY